MNEAVRIGTVKNEGAKTEQIKLMEDSFTDEEVSAVNKVIKSGKYTQGHQVKKFEKEFATYHGMKYGVMVNSGSSANLIAVQVLKHKHNLADGDEVLVPAVTWPTTIYPILQNNLVPVFCDVDESYNIYVDSMERMLTEKTKAVFIVHLLGQPASDKVRKFCNDKNLLILEDCCESTGAEIAGRKIGNWGLASTFSFYFGHHMTTVEGGIILTDDDETVDLLRSMRSHGWVRGSSRENEYREVFKDTHFVFDMLGYNLRSTEINAALGLVQLKKLPQSIDIRRRNHSLFTSLAEKSILLKHAQLQSVKLDETSSFSFGIVFESENLRDEVFEYAMKQGVECRLLVAGNLLQQPVFKKMAGVRADDCKMADKINARGLYFPNNQFIDKENIVFMIKTIIDAINVYTI